ncbi:hypothetical protein FKP32DRAFT_1574838 [Trametes sanguinea]|nr:hypothetical protein FKP32DRAFT_1574838 [Trametes sanguinea]
MFANKFTTLLAPFLAAASVASAGPAPDIDVEPHITSPKAGDVWPIGSTQSVTWDTSKIPPLAVNQTVSLYLGYINDPSGNEHLDFDHPLAANVPITAGSALVTVPDVTPRDDYVVDLYGNSGNISPKFTISN